MVNMFGLGQQDALNLPGACSVEGVECCPTAGWAVGPPTDPTGSPGGVAAHVLQPGRPQGLLVKIVSMLVLCARSTTKLTLASDLPGRPLGRLQSPEQRLHQAVAGATPGVLVCEPHQKPARGPDMGGVWVERGGVLDQRVLGLRRRRILGVLGVGGATDSFLGGSYSAEIIGRRLYCFL